VALTLWRLTKAQYAHTAFDGEGARLYGGRWNSPGRAVVYLAGSLALAALEILVHVKSQRELEGYVKLRVEAPKDVVSEPSALPSNWRQGRAPDETRAIGDAWLQAGETLLLRVPSVIIPEESNYLLNPSHPDFDRLTVGEAEPFSFDPRLRGG
jgi:RES domain-containing protein